ncbi:predicted protein [Histoplasma capsulatum var. duboisii H88]|uniref:Predicted protein n=1 Tax=Ajellomyces capsulatus (strain H88) TaxID=544711 RepID=F0U5T8_AJEC8|nr:predicted protein [Histoplasma capsulatum var. duboisii H88]
MSPLMRVVTVEPFCPESSIKSRTRGEFSVVCLATSSRARASYWRRLNQIERQLLGIAGTGGLTTIELFANWYETTVEEETDSLCYKTVELSYHCGRQKWVT